MQRVLSGCIAITALLALSGCGAKGREASVSSTENKLSITESVWGTAPGGEEVKAFTLTNANGTKAVIIEFGGILHELHVPDQDGNLADVVLGCHSIEDYDTVSPYFGALVGRYANRIAKGKFTLEGEEYTLAVNNEPNSLHGGVHGFNRKVWHGTSAQTGDSVSVTLTCTSADGEEGYPGAMNVSAAYTLTNDNKLDILFEATTDKTTVVNLTHHAYFNLAGHDSGKDVLAHELQLMAAKYTPFDDTLIPTGAIDPVASTPLDFTAPTAIGARIADVPGGYDHNYVLDNQSGDFALAARVVEPDSGRVLEVYSDQPGIQFYTGNGLDGSFAGKGGVKYQTRQGFCLEPQKYPDTPNHPDFPSAVLKPGDTYRHHMAFAFSNQ